ncbi:hypothetical protein TNCV_4896121 [Trichonephila clavipes]|uniref:Uncharacterized protein n=1 Tax=Trichonephila clavipes TaxID=2585209 RepID=A0A8X6VX01_TRICX|nr:hypothetical protein TNCV_4896121 [Trichonephila clavipes]
MVRNLEARRPNRLHVDSQCDIRQSWRVMEVSRNVTLHDWEYPIIERDSAWKAVGSSAQEFAGDSVHYLMRRAPISADFFPSNFTPKHHVEKSHPPWTQVSQASLLLT